jgi:hypothetical protein
MDKDEITVGRRFSKQSIEKKELNRIKAGFPRGVDPEEYIAHLTNTLKNEDQSFSNYLKSTKDFFIATLKEKNLPADPYWYPIGGPLGVKQKWQPISLRLERQDKEDKEITTNGMGLHDYLLHLGCEYDSLEHITGYGIFLIEMIEITIDSDKDMAIEFAFGLGKIVTLLNVYTKLTIDSIRGGKNKTNPWPPLSQHLLERYPNQSQQQIWRKIPTSSRIEIGKADYIYVSYFFYCREQEEDEKERLLAFSDKTGQQVGRITFESFRTRYLSKHSK